MNNTAHASGIRLIVGLGNPGEQYTETRHNAGFWFIDAVVNAYNAQLKAETKFSGIAGKASIAQQPVYLLKPTTFMNKSGLAVRQICQFYKIQPAQILVAHDELDLSPGQSKLKFSGGHGGHNGLRDIHQHCGADYWRLRIGIGHPGSKEKVTGYVLGRCDSDSHISISRSIDEAVKVMDDAVLGAFDSAMQNLHSVKI